MIETQIAKSDRVITPTRQVSAVATAPRRRDGSLSEVLWLALYSPFDVRF